MYVFYLYLYLTSFYSSQLWSFLFVTGINDGYLTANTRFLLELTFLLTHHEPLLDEFWGLKERYKVFCIKKKERKEDSIWEGERKKKRPRKMPQSIMMKDFSCCCLYCLYFLQNYTSFFVLHLTPYFGTQVLLITFIFLIHVFEDKHFLSTSLPA